MVLKNAIAYIRVSTEGQAEEDRYGKDAQRLAILDYAEKNGYGIVKWVVEVGSGAKERPLLEEIVYGNDVENPPIDAVIVYKNDRVARDTKLYFTYLYFLERKGVKLLSTQEEFEDEFANVYRALLQFVAEQERKNITRRTMAGKEAKALKGGYIGGRVPFGYAAIGGRLEIVPGNAEIVRIMFQLHDKGYSLNSISDYLNERGYTNDGASFTKDKIRGYIQNRKTYEGFIKLHGEWIKGIHEPII